MVLSLPFPLRRLAAFRADVLTALSAMFVEEIFRATGARKRGAKTEGGAITHVQRFGGSLNLNVHFHVVVLDGAFERAPEGIRFREGPPPPQDAIERVAKRVHERARSAGSDARDCSTSARPRTAPTSCRNPRSTPAPASRSSVED